jgi:ABC-type enterochelin transport system substrate-binding protein
MNNFVLAMGAHKNNLIYYMDTDSFYVHSSVYKQFLSEFKDELGGGKNDYGNGKYII